MVRRFLFGFFQKLNQLLQAPQKVIWICLGLTVLNLIIDGSLFRLWTLNRDHTAITEKIDALQIKNQDLKVRLKKAKEPAFLEREARNRFDLVNEGDLVFVFSEEEAP